MMRIRPTQTHDAFSISQLPADGPAAPRSGADDLQGGPAGTCCSLGALAKGFSPSSIAVPAMLTVTLLALGLAGYFASVAAGLKDAAASAAPPAIAFPATIDATASATSEKYSIATGVISEEAEGFFVLDHNSGLLQCSVFYPRVGKFLGTFTGSVGELIGGGVKGGGYIMVTGQADMTRGGRGASLAPSLVYVLNTGSGNFAAFAVPFDRQAANTGRPQVAALIPMGTGTASVLPTR